MDTPATKNDVRTILKEEVPQIVAEVIAQAVPKMITEAITKSVTPIVNDTIEKNNEYLVNIFKTEFLHVYKILAEHDKKFDKIGITLGEMRKDIREIATDVRDIKAEVSVTRGYRDLVENHDTRIKSLEEVVFPTKAP